MGALYQYTQLLVREEWNTFREGLQLPAGGEAERPESSRETGKLARVQRHALLLIRAKLECGPPTPPEGIALCRFQPAVPRLLQGQGALAARFLHRPLKGGMTTMMVIVIRPRRLQRRQQADPDGGLLIVEPPEGP